MNKIETEMENQRALFLAHQRGCTRCRGFNHSALAMVEMCHAGIIIYHALLDSETCYITGVIKIPISKSPTSLRRRARDTAIRAEIC